MATTNNVDILDCPVCYKRLTPPIQTCENGHGVCEDCRKNLTSCGLCRKNFSTGSNTLLNQMVERIPLNCKYGPEGCNQLLRFNTVADHEKICKYKKENCLICGKKLPFFEMNNHLKTCKPTSRCEIAFSSKNLFTHYLTEEETYRHYLVYITNVQTHFLLRLIDNRKKMYFLVQYMGKDQENSGKYKYKLKIHRGLYDFYVSYTGLCVPYVRSSNETKMQKGINEVNLETIFLNDETFSTKKYIVEVTVSEVEAADCEDKCLICSTNIPMPEFNDHLKTCSASEKLECTFSTRKTISCSITDAESCCNRLFYISNVQTHFLLRLIANRNKICFCVQYTGKNQKNAGKYKYDIRINQGLFDSYASFTGICVPYIYSVEETKVQKGRIELDLESIFLTDDAFSSKKFDLEITFCEGNRSRKRKMSPERNSE